MESGALVMFFRNKSFFVTIMIVLLGLSFFLFSDEKTLSYSEEHYAGARSDCPVFQDADTLQLNPSGPFALPADQSVVFQSIIKDSSNNVINADPLWGASNGTIISSSGFGQATFVPHSTGQVTVWACVEGINTTASVTVVQGSTDQLILESNLQS